MLKQVVFLRNLPSLMGALPIDQKGGKDDTTTQRRSSCFFNG